MSHAWRQEVESLNARNGSFVGRARNDAVGVPTACWVTCQLNVINYACFTTAIQFNVLLWVAA